MHQWTVAQLGAAKYMYNWSLQGMWGQKIRKKIIEAEKFLQRDPKALRTPSTRKALRTPNTRLSNVLTEDIFVLFLP